MAAFPIAVGHEGVHFALDLDDRHMLVLAAVDAQALTKQGAGILALQRLAKASEQKAATNTRT